VAHLFFISRTDTEAVLRGIRKKVPSFDFIGRNHAIVGEALLIQSVCPTSSFRVWRIYVTLGGAGCDFDGKQ
jgi:hypothetical protein